MDLKFKKPLVVLDIETTGVNPRKDDIIELYMMKVINNEFIDEYHSKFKINKNIPLFISKLTGIYDWHLKNSPELKNELNNIKTFLENSIVVGHNLSFDLSFLKNAFEKNKIEIALNEKIDTLKMSRALLRNKVRNHKLSTISQFFKTQNKNNHNAKDDVLTTYEILMNLLLDKKLNGISNFKELTNFLNSPDISIKKKFNIGNLPDSAGVYIFKDNENYTYIGKSSNLKKRIQSHLSYSRSYKSNKIISNSNILEMHSCKNELEAIIIESRLINLLQPNLNRKGKKLTKIYWIKLKSNKPNLEISKVEDSKNTIFQYGPIIGFNLTQNIKQILNSELQLVNCKKNNSRTSKCSDSILNNSICSCLTSFDLENYIYSTKVKLETFFENIENNLLIFQKNIKDLSDQLKYEQALTKKKYFDYLNKVNTFINFYNLINSKDNIKTYEYIKFFGLKIENQKVSLTNKNLLESLNKYPINISTTDQYIQELNLIMQFLALHPNRI